MLENLQDGGTFLLTSEYGADEVWKHLPGRVQKQIIDKKLKFYVVNAIGIAQNIGLGPRINTIMQSAFFKISGIIDQSLAIDSIKKAIKKTYGRKGDAIVAKNIQSIDEGLAAGVHEVKVPAAPTNPVTPIRAVPDDAPDFVKNVTAPILRQEGDRLPVSKIPDDGVWPSGTTQYEKRNIAVTIPVWNPQVCLQCPPAVRSSARTR